MKNVAFSFILAQALTWDNVNNFGSPISRSQPLRVRWSAADATGNVVVTGGVATEAPAEKERVSARFTCTERVSAGEFTIPTTILQMLPRAATRGFLTVYAQATCSQVHSRWTEQCILYSSPGRSDRHDHLAISLERLTFAPCAPALRDRN